MPKLGWWFLFVGTVLGMSLGILVAKTVQFDWNFFGATLISFGDVGGLWAGCIVVGGCLGAFAGLCLFSTGKKKGDC